MTDEDEWEWLDEPVHLTVGSAQASGGPVEDDGDEPLDLRWKGLYVPDMTSMTGWAVHRVRDRKAAPQMRARRAGFRMIRRKP